MHYTACSAVRWSIGPIDTRTHCAVAKSATSLTKIDLPKMSNSTGGITTDSDEQSQALLYNVGFGYLPLLGIVAFAVIGYETRASLAALRVTLALGRAGADSVHSSLKLLLFALLLRISWMVLLAEDFAGKLTGPSCYTSIACGGQIFHSALNRISALLYFMFICRMGPTVGQGFRAWSLDMRSMLSSSTATGSKQQHQRGSSSMVAADQSLGPGTEAAIDPRGWTPPSLTWDMSLLATDGFLLMLQIFVLLLSLALPNNSTSYTPLYEAYQWQVSALSALCSVWFLAFAAAVLTHACSREGKQAALQRRRQLQLDGSGTRSWFGAGRSSNGNEKAPLLSYAQGSPAGSSKSSGSASAGGNAGARRNSSHKRRSAVFVPQAEFKQSKWASLTTEAKVAWIDCRAVCDVMPWQAWFTILSCLLISFLFAIRIPLFLWSSLAGFQLSGTESAVLYPQFYYTLPEIVPPLLLLHMAMPRGLIGITRWYERAPNG